MVLLQPNMNVFTFAKTKKEKSSVILKNKSWGKPSSKKIKVLKKVAKQ